MTVGHASIDPGALLASWTNRETVRVSGRVGGRAATVSEVGGRGAGDRGLAELAAGGDGSAYAEILDRYAQGVYRYAFALTRDRDDAEQLTEETFLTAWRTLADVRLITPSLVPWLLSVCTKTHEGWLRGRRSRARALTDADLLLAAWSDEDDAQETLDWIVDAVGEITDDDRRLTETCLLRGLPYRRAAAAAGLSAHGAKRLRPIRSVPVVRPIQQGFEAS